MKYIHSEIIYFDINMTLDDFIWKNKLDPCDVGVSVYDDYKKDIFGNVEYLKKDKPLTEAEKKKLNMK